MSEMPYFREVGIGPTVVCLHSSASSGGQWRSLTEALSRERRVIAPDLYGYGKNAAKDSGTDFGLEDELDWLEPLISHAGDQFSLVGRSYGGLIALLIALRHPERVQAVAIYEPATWSIAVHADSNHPGAKEIDALRQGTIQMVDKGESLRAAELFVRYWAGECSWDAMSQERREITAAGMRKVRNEFAGEIAAHKQGSHTVEKLGTITAPIGYFMGAQTKASVRRVAEVLVPSLRNVRLEVLEGLGHMGPVTHPAIFNRAIQEFLSGNA
jgi:pimeloyl-ACP methyl ester carboxylesterase